jgi:hypothetical protein
MCRLLARHIRSLDVAANLYGRIRERRTWWNRGMIPGWMMQRWIDRTYQEIYSAIELQSRTFADGGYTKVIATIEGHKITSAALVEQKRAGKFAVSPLESNELFTALSSPSFEPAFDFNIVSDGRSVCIDERLERFEGVPTNKRAAQRIEFGFGYGRAETDPGLDIDL